MSRVTVNEQYLQDTADAIREKTGEVGTYKPSQFANAISDISSGGIQTALVSNLSTGTILFYTDENMTVQTDIEIVNKQLPIGTIIAIWSEGPTSLPGTPAGVTQIAQYGSLTKGQLTVYEVTG